MQPDISVNLGGIAMRNPVTVASGTFGYGPEYADLVDLNSLGAIIVKGICMQPHEGNPPPRTAEVPGGMLNAIGLPGPGVQGFADKYLPFLGNYDVPVIVNIWGRTVDEYGEVAARLEQEPGVHGLEINVSCPNIEEGSRAFGTRHDMFCRVVERVRSQTTKPIIPKLAPQVTSITEFAMAAEQCGADAVSLINSIPAMAIDIETRRPRLANRVGGLTGPAVHPVAVKMVWETASAVKLPVLAMGGISEPADAIEFLIAGATAVAVGTANFIDPATSARIIAGITDYMCRHHMRNMTALTGSIVL